MTSPAPAAPRMGVHLAAFTAFGAVVGAATTAAVQVLLSGMNPFDGPLLLATLVNAVASAAAIALGWRSTARRALGLGPARTHDPDAVAEDANVRSASRHASDHPAD